MMEPMATVTAKSMLDIFDIDRRPTTRMVTTTTASISSADSTIHPTFDHEVNNQVSALAPVMTSAPS